ncbi:MAG: DUF5916 domain-containing protein [Acidobacteriota bacterium]
MKIRNRNKLITVIISFLLLSFIILPKASSNKEPVPIPKLQEKPKIDGKLDEPCWRNAKKFLLPYETRPGENIPVPVKTEVLTFYTQSNLYFALICYDPNPEIIRARYSNRDTIFNDDLININLDTFNDERRNYFFGCNPLGVQRDGIETQGGNPSWDAIWSSAGQITDKGYIIEIAIPFASLQFPRINGKQIWGLDISRFYQRDYMRRLGLVKMDRNNNSYQSQFMKIIGFEGVKPGKNIEIIPTFTGIKTDVRDPFPDGDFRSESKTFDPGITAKWGITSNLTLNGTVNPDFSQVEADARQLDINQPFALFFQEKRPFFTEGTDFFVSPMNIIYTRTIREPLWGLKLSGKEGKNTIGAYFVQDELTNIIFPGSQGSSSTSVENESTAAVFRYKRDFGNSFTLGAIVTNRQGDEYFNRVFGIDGEALLSRRNRLRFQVIGSSTKYDNAIAHEFNQHSDEFSDRAVKLSYNYTSRNLNIYAQYQDIGKDFRADLGFMPQVDFRTYFSDINYRWQKNKGWWSQLAIGANYRNAHDQEGGFLEEGVELYFEFQGTKQSHMYSEFEYSKESYNGIIYKLNTGFANLNFRPIADLQIYMRTGFGDRIDYSNSRLGKRFNLNGGFNYNLGRHIKLNMNHNFENMKVNKKKLYTANITQSSLSFHLNTRIFLRGIIQYVNYQRNSENYLFEIGPEYKELFTQFLFSYQLNPRTVFFLGYTDNYTGYREYKSNYDVPLKQKNRTLFMKVSYSFQI